MKLLPVPRRLVALRCAGALLLLPWLAGCTSLFEAKPDLTRFYLLSAPAAVAHEVPAHGSTLGLARVELPAYLRSPAIILRPGGTEVRAAAEARWAEPLEQGIARVLRETLQAQPGVRSVVVYPAPHALPPQFELTVRVLACEGVVEPTGRRARFAATWELRNGQAAPETAVVASGVFEGEAAEWADNDYAALTARLGEAVAALAGELAAKLPR